MDSNKILVGSNAFFKNIEGFKGKDKDYLILVENPIGFKDKKEIYLRGIDCFYYKLDTPENMINTTLKYNDSMAIGKFLVPEVIEKLQLTIDDLKKLKPLTNKLDKEHQYQKIIYDSYIRNKSFKITKKTLMKAYESYKETRKEKKMI